MSVAIPYAMQISAFTVHKCKEAIINRHNRPDKSGTVALMLYFSTPDWIQALQVYTQTNNRGIGAALKRQHPASPISEEERNKRIPRHVPILDLLAGAHGCIVHAIECPRHPLMLFQHLRIDIIQLLQLLLHASKLTFNVMFL
jgi:hypothetical protein